MCTPFFPQERERRAYKTGATTGGQKTKEIIN